METEASKLKGMALNALRWWDAKQERGAKLAVWTPVVYEIRSELLPDDWSAKDCHDVILQVINAKVELARRRQSHLGEAPGVKILVYTLLANSGNLKKLFEEATHEVNKKRPGQPLVYSKENLPDLARDLWEAGRVLGDWQAWGTPSEVVAARQLLQRWSSVWALANLSLAEGREHHDSYKGVVGGLPDGAFRKILGIKVGDACASPFNGALRKPGQTQVDPTPARGALAVRVSVTGKFKGEELDWLQDEGAGGRSLYVSSLGLYKVTQNRFDGEINLELAPEGCPFAADTAVVEWKERVLACAAREEVHLRASAAEEWAVSAGENINQMKAVTDAPSSTCEGKMLEAMPEGEGLEVLTKVSPFSFYAIVGSDAQGGKRKKFLSARLCPQQGYPFMMRPAGAFLSQLGREEQRDMLFKVDFIRAITVKEPILSLTDRSQDIVVNHETISSYYKHCLEKGEDKDESFSFVQNRWNQDCEAHGKEKIGVPDPKEIFGDQEFRISVGEVQQLVRTTHIDVADVPLRFFLELVSKLTITKEHRDAFRALRAVSLRSIAEADIEAFDAMRKVVAGGNEVATGRRNKAKADYEKLPFDPIKTEHSWETGDWWTAHEKFVNNTSIVKSTEYEVKLLTRGTIENRTIQSACRALKALFEKAKSAPEWYGFSSQAEVHDTFSKSLVEISTEMCVTQQAYFFSKGLDGNANQLCGKSSNIVTFLNSPGVDFMYPAGVMHKGWKGFLPHGKVVGLSGMYTTIHTNRPDLVTIHYDPDLDTISMTTTLGFIPRGALYAKLLAGIAYCTGLPNGGVALQRVPFMWRNCAGTFEQSDIFVCMSAVMRMAFRVGAVPHNYLKLKLPSFFSKADSARTLVYEHLRGRFDPGRQRITEQVPRWTSGGQLEQRAGHRFADAARAWLGSDKPFRAVIITCSEEQVKIVDDLMTAGKESAVYLRENFVIIFSPKTDLDFYGKVHNNKEPCFVPFSARCVSMVFDALLLMSECGAIDNILWIADGRGGTGLFDGKLSVYQYTEADHRRLPWVEFRRVFDEKQRLVLPQTTIGQYFGPQEVSAEPATISNEWKPFVEVIH
eukprot:Hpha_TRINITY_DN15280_c1_g2::TRINITY_DN15280_c1_g2_i1::g.67728::m.67728